MVLALHHQSPRYLQSGERAENSVRTVKRSSRCYSMLAGAFVKILLQELHLFSMYHSLKGWLIRF